MMMGVMILHKELRCRYCRSVEARRQHRTAKPTKLGTSNSLFSEALKIARHSASRISQHLSLETIINVMTLIIAIELHSSPKSKLDPKHL
jgi:hypothetical protein